jgi:hypothetical protein
MSVVPGGSELPAVARLLAGSAALLSLLALTGCGSSKPLLISVQTQAGTPLPGAAISIRGYHRTLTTDDAGATRLRD